jgi:peroxiredoxin
LQLGRLQKIEPQLIDLGYQIIAISPDTPERMNKYVKKKEYKYRLLSDSKMNAAKAFGIAFRVDDKTYGKLKLFTIDLEKKSGEPHHFLPVPSVFVLGKDGIIKFEYVNPDYKVRIEEEKLLEEARKALSGK